jgi:hypothetical protein
MKKYLKALSDNIIQRRWMTMALYAWTAGVLVPTAISATEHGEVWIAALDAFALGLLVASLAHTMLIPSLAKGHSEIELATMKAQMEKSLNEAWAEFIKRNPEARGFMATPTMMRQ